MLYIIIHILKIFSFFSKRNTVIFLCARTAFFKKKNYIFITKKKVQLLLRLFFIIYRIKFVNDYFLTVYYIKFAILRKWRKTMSTLLKFFSQVKQILNYFLSLIFIFFFFFLLYLNHFSNFYVFCHY